MERGGKMHPSLAIGRKPLMMPRSPVAMHPPAPTTWRRLTSVASTPDQVDEATIALTEYLTEVVEEKQRKPVDDLLSHLGLAEVDGAPVSRDYMVGMAMLLLLAGHETTASTIGIGAAHLMGS